MDPSVELVIDGQVLCAKDELLNLTATEACRSYGDPPQPLLGAGTAESIEDMLDELHGAGNYTLHRVVPSWSEDLAQYLTAITPVLLAFGLLGLFIEFKTPGFGVFGVTGLVLLAIVFFGHHVAGLSGYEPMLLLLLGIVLIGVEIFLLPGTVVPAVTGAIMIIVALLWAMLDIWPDQPIDFSGDFLVRPLVNITLGVVGAVILFIALLRFLPRGGPWGRMILQTAVAGGPAGVHPLDQQDDGTAQSELVGSRGVAATDMFPSGQVTIQGRRYEARLEVGTVDAGTPLVVTRVSEFGLIVEPDPSKELESWKEAAT